MRVKKNLKIEESHFYAFSRITRNFLVKHAVKLLVPSSRNESPAQVANIHSVMTLRADELEHRRFRACEASNLRAEGAQRSRNAVLRDSRNGSSDPHQLHSD